MAYFASGFSWIWSRSAENGTPSHVLSYLLHVVTQWMSFSSVVVPSALNWSQVNVFSSSTNPHTWKRHDSRSMRGMLP